MPTPPLQAEFERAREPPTELPPRLLATNERRKRERGLEELGIGLTDHLLAEVAGEPEAAGELRVLGGPGVDGAGLRRA